MSERLPSLTDLYLSAQRELRLRAKVYPRWVAEGRMLQSQAQYELACQRAIVALLERLLESRSGQQDLFDREVRHEPVRDSGDEL